MKIHLHIDRLVIDGDGTSTFDGDLVRAALTRELAQYLAESPPALAGGAVPLLRAQAALPPSASAASFGAGIARALHGTLVPANAPGPRAAGKGRAP
jgi:hypothetical protein